MPIRMTHTPGIPGEAYDQIVAAIEEPLSQSPGFISHSASVGDDGVTVSEVWESREQWTAWYEQAVKPHLPPGGGEPTVEDLHKAFGHA
jgi:heme-degrading monooxygenase HmoA